MMHLLLYINPNILVSIVRFCHLPPSHLNPKTNKPNIVVVHLHINPSILTFVVLLHSSPLLFVCLSSLHRLPSHFISTFHLFYLFSNPILSSTSISSEIFCISILHYFKWENYLPSLLPSIFCHCLAYTL